MARVSRFRREAESGVCSESPPADLEVEVVINNHRVESQTDSGDVLKDGDWQSRILSTHANDGM